MQQRNLELAVGVPVLDRVGLIIDIFAQSARTREARLQVIFPLGCCCLPCNQQVVCTQVRSQFCSVCLAVLLGEQIGGCDK